MTGALFFAHSPLTTSGHWNGQMGERTSYLLKRYVFPATAYLIVLYGWLDFIAKPFVSSSNAKKMTFQEAFLDLFSPVPQAYGWLGAGYLWLLCTAILAFITLIFVIRPIRYVVRYLEVSEAPLSVLRSDIVLDFNDDWSVCEITRSQILHANKPGLNAYEYQLLPSEGEISIKSLSSDIDGVSVTKRRHDNKRGKNIECIEEYTRSLPFSFWTTYLPDSLVLLMHDTGFFFAKSMLSRKIVTIDRGEYNKENPYFELKARNKVSRIDVMFRFLDGQAPPNGVRAHLIQQSAIAEMDIISDYDQGRQIYKLRRSKLKPDQTIRIVWDPKAGP